MAARLSVLLCLAVCLLACLSPLGVQSHGGGLHRWTFQKKVLDWVPTAVVSNDVHSTVATCSSWTTLNLTALTPSSFTMPWSPSNLNMTVEGSIDVVSYLSNNCTSSLNSGLFPVLRYSMWMRQGSTWVSRPAPSNLVASGYGFEGTCSAPGNMYRNNAALQDSRFNLAWWGYENQLGVGMNSSNIYPGVQWGSAPQSWLFRNSTHPNRMKSILLFVQQGPVFCCNVNYTGFSAPEAVLPLGRNCSEPAPY